MSGKFKLALCQMSVCDSKEQNIQRAKDMVRQAAENGAKIVALPEMFNCPYRTSAFAEYAEEEGKSTTITTLSAMAKEHGIFLVGGSIPERCGMKIYNTSFVLDPEGKTVCRHRKMHLADMDVPGRITLHESDTLSPGNRVTTFDTPWCKVGVAICYDMRFPELSRLMVLEGASLIILPGAFNMTTGPAHWELLIRTRAVDNQVYFAAVSPARDTTASYVSYGHTMVSDPWGNVMAEAAEKDEIVYSDIETDVAAKVRGELPVLKNRRTDIYEIIKK